MGEHIERVTVTWEGPGTPVMEQVLRVDPGARPFEAVLADAPVGTVVTWRSPDAPRGHALERLPTLKLGDDAFAAHGLSPTQNVLTRRELCVLLQAAVAPGADPARVYPSEIELIDTGLGTEG